MILYLFKSLSFLNREDVISEIRKYHRISASKNI